ncbi:MAG: LamG domain-containing protein, partial [Candidatus Paceibacterota bacterium]
FESSKFKLGGDKDTVSTDGGSYPDLYEVGSNLSLAPLDYGDTSLVGYWKFDETTGTTAYDSSGRGNNGILTNNPIWTAGKKRGALRFSLASQYVSKSIVSSSPVALSISFWFNPDSINSSYRDMVGVADNDTGRFHLNNGDNAINWYPFINSGIIPVVGSWYYAVGVYDGLSKKIYVNGILRGTATNSTSFVFDRMKVGSDGEIFNGVLDEVSYYNRALSASEVTALYNATR